MAEWFKAHAWKACVGLYPTGSSNLPLSATAPEPTPEIRLEQVSPEAPLLTLAVPG